MLKLGAGGSFLLSLIFLSLKAKLPNCLFFPPKEYRVEHRELPPQKEHLCTLTNSKNGSDTKRCRDSAAEPTVSPVLRRAACLVGLLHSVKSLISH